MGTTCVADERCKFVDIAKGIGIVFVIAGHLFTYGGVIGKIIFSVHMPLFFVLAGFFAQKKNSDFIEKSLKKEFKTCFFPWFFFVLLGIIVTLIVPAWRVDISITNIMFCLYSGQPENFHIRPVWFLICLFWVKIFFRIWYQIYLRIRKNILLTVMFITVILVMAICIKDILWIFPYERLPLKMDSAMMGLFFYVIGYLGFPFLCDFEKSHGTKSKFIAAFFCVCIWVYLGVKNGASNLSNLTYNDSGMYIISAISGSVGIIIISMLIKKNKVLEFIGQNSMIIFALHSFPVYLYEYLLSVVRGKEIVHMLNMDWSETVIGTISITVLMLAAAKIIGIFRVKFSKNI